MSAIRGPLTPYIGGEVHGVLDDKGRHLLEFWNRADYDNVANAHLFAATTELLAHLENFPGIHSQALPYWDEQRKALIAKATTAP